MWSLEFCIGVDSDNLHELAQGSRISCSSTTPTGPGYSKQAGMGGKICPVVGAKSGESNIQGSSYLLLKYGYEPSHLWMNFGIITALMIIFCAIHLLAAEYILAQRWRGELLLFHRGHGKKQSQRVLDAENRDVSPIFAQDIENQVASEGFDKHSEAILRPSSVLHWNNLSYEEQTKKERKKILGKIVG